MFSLLLKYNCIDRISTAAVVCALVGNYYRKLYGLMTVQNLNTYNYNKLVRNYMYCNCIHVAFEDYSQEYVHVYYILVVVHVFL